MSDKQWRVTTMTRDVEWAISDDDDVLWTGLISDDEWVVSELRRCSDSSEALARCFVFTLLVCFRLLVISDLGFALYWFFFFFFWESVGCTFVICWACYVLGFVIIFFFFSSDFSLKIFFFGFFFSLKVEQIFFFFF